MVDAGGSDLHTIAYWDQLVQRGPGEALAVINGLLGDDRLQGEGRALAHGAAGRSLFELGRLDEAAEAARRGLSESADARRDIKTWVAMASSLVLAEVGEIDEALARLRALATDADGVELGRISVQIAYVLQHAGRLNESLFELDNCERLFTPDGHPRELSRVYNNRGVVLLQQGRSRSAAADFESAERVARAAGLTVVEAMAVANRAILLGRERRFAEALPEFERARGLYEAAGNPLRTVASMEIDRAEVMMHSGLLADARHAARAAITLVGPTDSPLLGDALLLQAQVELATGDTRAAIASARQARDALDRADRHDMLPQARSIVVQAGLRAALDREAARSALAEASQVVESLQDVGWTTQANELTAARIRAGYRWQLGAEIRDDVERLRVGTVDGRRDTALSGWWAEAVGRSFDGDAQGAIDACHRGLTFLDDIIEEATTLEARSAAMKIGSDVSQLLIELAIERGDADTVLAAAEGTRARALHDELAERERYRPLTKQGAHDLRVEVADRLGERTLVEWIVASGQIWAVVFSATGSRLVEIGDRSTVLRARDRLRMWLDLAASEPDEPSGRAMTAARHLDDLLIAPLDLPPDTGVALVPTGMLHGIPWSGLPSFAGRPISLTPNAQVWLQADRSAERPIRSVGLVIGPGVVGSDIERSAVMRFHPDSWTVEGAASTAATVCDMLVGADLVHVSAHGTFRSDRPLLSTLRLSDGEATLYDAVPNRVESLLVVLSSCEGGAQGTADGSEVLGLSAVLLARGAAAVLAPLTVVRELECADFVAEVHGELAAGEPFACAVAAVRQRWLADDDLSRWAVASSFSCFGSGAVAIAR